MATMGLVWAVVAGLVIVVFLVQAPWGSVELRDRGTCQDTTAPWLAGFFRWQSKRLGECLCLTHTSLSIGARRVACSPSSLHPTLCGSGNSCRFCTTSRKPTTGHGAAASHT